MTTSRRGAALPTDPGARRLLADQAMLLQVACQHHRQGIDRLRDAAGIINLGAGGPDELVRGNIVQVALQNIGDPLADIAG